MQMKESKTTDSQILDSETIDRALAGDRLAFRTLVQRYSHRAFQLAFRIAGDEAAAEDIVQEAFINAYRKLGQFNRRSSFFTWLHRITVNAALDHLRRTSRRPQHQALEETREADLVASVPDCPAESVEIRRRTRVAMKQLTEIERAAFTLKHFEGHSIKEICQLLSINSSACKQAIFRAVKKMRAALAPLVTT